MSVEVKNEERYNDHTAYMALKNLEKIRDKAMCKYERGDIYYVEPYYNAVGSEQKPGRPGIIVSNNKNNENSPTVEVVYMTTQDKGNRPTHVKIMGTGRESTALCEQIQTVDTQRLTNFAGTCTLVEMQAIDHALLISLGLENMAPKEKNVNVIKEMSGVKEVFKEESEKENNKETSMNEENEELITAMAQLSMMKQMYNDLLKQCMTKK